jgi:amino acid permease
MSVDTTTGGGEPPDRHHQFVLILEVTVIAFAAIVVLALAGQAVAAGVIGTVWAATCGLLAFWKPAR